MSNEYDAYIGDEVHQMCAEDNSGVFNPDLPHSFEQQMTTTLEDGTQMWL